MSCRVYDGEEYTVGSGGYGPAQWPQSDQRQGFFLHRVGFGAESQFYRMHRSSTDDGRFRIEVAQAQTSRQQIFDDVMFSYEGLKPLLVGFPLLLLPVWLAVHTGLSPLRRLSRELSSRHSADLTPIRSSLVYRELDPLARELNGALSRLASILQRERDFLADAAHQLRTPLAVISARCDTLANAREDTGREAAVRRMRDGLVHISAIADGELTGIADGVSG